MGLKIRLVHVVGDKHYGSFSWHTGDNFDTDYHTTKEFEVTEEEFKNFDATKQKYQKNLVCERHGCQAPEDVYFSMSTIPFYNTQSGKLDPGCAYYNKYLHEAFGKCPYWDNCNSDHLIIRMPDGGTWDTDSRASNCTMKEDRNHRCWIKHGDINKMTVDKQGITCQAGAGSIQMSNWHGFLRNGELVE